MKDNKCKTCGRKNVYMLADDCDDHITLLIEEEKGVQWFEFRITDGNYNSIAMSMQIYDFRGLVKELNNILKQFPEDNMEVNEDE